ncbi:MAG TPA: Tim44/TimA family putative adaptor protein [Methylovirgula sp.]
MPDSLDASTIVFALLAIFILWKLRSVLGSRNTGEKEPPPGSLLRPPSQPNPTVRSHVSDPTEKPLDSQPVAAQLPPSASSEPDPWKSYAQPGSKAAQGLEAIAGADATFDIESFVAGAKIAYDMILTAFAKGNRETLQHLLDQDVYESFDAAIAARQGRGETMKTMVESVEQISIDEANLRMRVAQITLHIRAKVTTATENAEGNVIEGSLDHPVELNDIWTFARDTQSRDPNWKLIATQTGH